MNVMLNPPTLNGKLVRTVAIVAQELISARTHEERAKVARVKLEDELAALVGVPTEGTQTKKLDGFKVTVSQPVTRKVDWAALDAISEEAFPDELRPVKWSRDLDKKKFDELQVKDRELFQIMQRVITATPNKVAVKAEPIE